MAKKKVQEDYGKSLLESYARWRYFLGAGGIFAYMTIIIFTGG